MRCNKNCCTSTAVKGRHRNAANEIKMRTTAVNRCRSSHLYASLVVASFMEASSASFPHAIAGALVGGVLGRISNIPRRHQVRGIMQHNTGSIVIQHGYLVAAPMPPCQITWFRYERLQLNPRNPFLATSTCNITYTCTSSDQQYPTTREKHEVYTAE